MKNEKPGWDTLMNVDWPKALELAGATPPQGAVVPTPARQPDAVTTIVAPSPGSNTSIAATVRWRWVSTGGALVLGFLAVVLLRNDASK